jgi:hypothetical protein
MEEEEDEQWMPSPWLAEDAQKEENDKLQENGSSMNIAMNIQRQMVLEEEQLSQDIHQFESWLLSAERRLLHEPISSSSTSTLHPHEKTEPELEKEKSGRRCTACLVVPFDIYASSEDLRRAIYREDKEEENEKNENKANEKPVLATVLCVPKRYFEGSIYADVWDHCARAGHPERFRLRSSVERLLQLSSPLFWPDVVPHRLRDCVAYLQWHIYLTEAHPEETAMEEACLHFSNRAYKISGDLLSDLWRFANRQRLPSVSYLDEHFSMTAEEAKEKHDAQVLPLQIIWNLLNCLDANSTRDKIFFLVLSQYRDLFCRMLLRLPVLYRPSSSRFQTRSAIALCSSFRLDAEQWRYVCELDERRRAEGCIFASPRLAPPSSYCLFLPDPVGHKRFSIGPMSRQLCKVAAVDLPSSFFSASSSSSFSPSSSSSSSSPVSSLLLVLSPWLYNDYRHNQLSAALFRCNVSMFNRLWRKLLEPRFVAYRSKERTRHYPENNPYILLSLLSVPLATWAIGRGFDEEWTAQIEGVILDCSMRDWCNVAEIRAVVESEPEFELLCDTLRSCYAELKNSNSAVLGWSDSFEVFHAAHIVAGMDSEPDIIEMLAPPSAGRQSNPGLRLYLDSWSVLKTKKRQFYFHRRQQENAAVEASEDAPVKEEDGKKEDTGRLIHLTKTLFGMDDVVLLPVKLSVQDHFPYLKRLGGEDLRQDGLWNLQSGPHRGAQDSAVNLFWMCTALQIALLHCDSESSYSSSNKDMHNVRYGVLEMEALNRVHSTIASFFAIERAERRLPPVYVLHESWIYRLHWDERNPDHPPIQPLMFQDFYAEAIENHSHYWTIFSVPQYIEFFGTNRYTCLEDLARPAPQQQPDQQQQQQQEDRQQQQQKKDEHADSLREEQEFQDLKKRHGGTWPFQPPPDGEDEN